MNFARLFRIPLRHSSSRATARTFDPTQTVLLEEKCILVDPSDVVIGSASKRDCHRLGTSGDLLLHRAFSVYVFNSDRKLLLQKRSNEKIIFPNLIANTCCSHPLSDVEGENEGIIGVKRAAQRRLVDELGWPKNSIELDEFKFMTRLIYKIRDETSGWGEHELGYLLFVVDKDLPLTPNPNEISQLYYVGREEFDTFLENEREFLSPWFRLVATHWLKKWWDNLDNLEKFQSHETIHIFHNYTGGVSTQ